MRNSTATPWSDTVTVGTKAFSGGSKSSGFTAAKASCSPSSHRHSAAIHTAVTKGMILPYYQNEWGDYIRDNAIALAKSQREWCRLLFAAGK